MTAGPVGVLLLLPLLACAMASQGPAEFTVEVLATTPVAELPADPAVTLAVRDDRLALEGVVGLGATGHAVAVTGRVVGDTIAITLATGLPEGMAGLTVLTAYRFRITSSPLPAGSYEVRLWHQPAEGESALLCTGRVRID